MLEDIVTTEELVLRLVDAGPLPATRASYPSAETSNTTMITATMAAYRFTV